jgi:hypothetical protein
VSKVEATCYLQVEPEFNYNGSKVWGARVVRMTQRKPESPLGGTVLVGITLCIPEEAFLPLRPEAVIDVPLSHTAVEVVSSPISEGAC